MELLLGSVNKKMPALGSRTWGLGGRGDPFPLSSIACTDLPPRCLCPALGSCSCGAGLHKKAAGGGRARADARGTQSGGKHRVQGAGPALRAQHGGLQLHGKPGCARVVSSTYLCHLSVSQTPSFLLGSRHRC